MKSDIHIKISADILEKVDRFCKNRGENRSTLVRRLLYKKLAEYSYLDEEKEKALGMEVKKR